MRTLIAACVMFLAAAGLEASPTPLSRSDLGPAWGSQFAGAISASPDGFLVGWLDTRLSEGGEIRITKLDRDGAVTDAVGTVLFTQDSGFTGWLKEPEIVWTGDRWLVAFASYTEVWIVPVAPDGTPMATLRSIASGPLAPSSGLNLLVSGDRVFVTGLSGSGASFMIVSSTGDVLVPPRLVERQSEERPLFGVQAALGNGEVLLVDWALQPCSGCPFLVTHRIGLDGREIARSIIADPPGMQFYDLRLSPLRGGYLLVGQQLYGTVRYLTLSSDATTVALRGTLATANETTFAPSDIVIRAGAAATEVYYFLPRSSPSSAQQLQRSLIYEDGRVSSAAFPIADADLGELSIASNDRGTVAVMARSDVAHWSDLVARAGGSADALQEARGYPVTMSATRQSDAQAVRRGEETLVTWIEGNGASGNVLATTLDARGTPRGEPPVTLFERRAYSIVTDGEEYLAATESGDRIRVRRLRSDLTWRDSEWTTLVTGKCSPLSENSLSWDGSAWWIGWSSCGADRDPVVQRFDRNLQPLTSPVTIPALEAAGPVHLAPFPGSMVVLWSGYAPPCQICTCPVPSVPMWGARVGPDGRILTPETLIVSETDEGSVSLASNGSELLALWAGYAYPMATRIRGDLSTPDVTADEYGRHGAVLEETMLWSHSLAWDGEAWVAVTSAYVWDGVGHQTHAFRRFYPSDNLPSAWRGAEQRQLETSSRSGRAIVVGSPGGATLLLQELATEETTGVLRYFIRNMTDPPRTRGVRP